MSSESEHRLDLHRFRQRLFDRMISRAADKRRMPFDILEEAANLCATFFRAVLLIQCEVDAAGELQYRFKHNDCGDEYLARLSTATLTLKPSTSPNELIFIHVVDGVLWGITVLHRNTPFTHIERSHAIRICDRIQLALIFCTHKRVSIFRTQLHSHLAKHPKPKDLLHGLLRRLWAPTRYSHSATLYLPVGGSGQYEIVAERLRFGASQRIGKRFTLNALDCQLINCETHIGFSRVNSKQSWKPWILSPFVSLPRGLRVAEVSDRHRLVATSTMIVPVPGADAPRGVLQLTWSNGDKPTQFTLSAINQAAIDLSSILAHVQQAESVEQSLVARSRAETLGIVFSMLAHDLNRYLQHIQGELDNAIFHLNKNHLSDVELVKSACARAYDSVGELGGFVSEFALKEHSWVGDTAINICDVIHKVATDGRHRYPEMLISVTPPRMSSKIYVRIKPNLLRRAIDNIFANSVQACSSQGRIEIRIEQKNARSATIVIDDDGVGIPEGDREAIFNWHVSGSGSGTGLGLAYCQHMALAVGGAICAMNSPLGGARIEITLPTESQESS